jgi:hypothetical protein
MAWLYFHLELGSKENIAMPLGLGHDFNPFNVNAFGHNERRLRRCDSKECARVRGNRKLPSPCGPQWTLRSENCY